MRQWRLVLLCVLLSGLVLACSPPEPELPAAAAKIIVVGEGMHEIRAADLEAAGLGWGDFDPVRLQLLHRGQEEPLWTQGRGPELTVRFYGRASTSRYSRENVYWLQFGAGPGQRMEVNPSAAGQERETTESYVATAHLEENRLYSPRVVEGDHWFWDSLPAPATKTIPATLTALAPGPGYLRVAVWGSTEGPPDPDHHLRMSFNGELVADELWDGQGRRTIAAALPRELLSEGPNTVTLEAPGDTGVAADIVFLDWVEVGYPRHFVAVDDRLSFESDGSLNQLDGFSAQGVVVFDVTYPEKPALITDVQQGQGAEASAVRLWGETGHRYLAVGPTGFLPPARIERASLEPDLRAPDNRADYLIIAHPDLMSALQPLLAWREKQGLAVIAVPVEAVYDRFNHGLPEPEAIRTFLQYAVASWQKPALQYVLLVGDATYDPRGYLAPPGSNRLPTFLVPTVFGGETASDTAFVHLDDDLLPDMAIGRLPARTPQQVRVVVQKILAYEQGREGGAWQRRVLLVADGQDGLFRTQSQALLDVLPAAYEGEELYPEPGAQDANQTIRQALEQGSLVVNYIGHGSINQWGKDRLFTTDDAAALSNGSRLPVVLNFTCLTGLFSHPQVESLAEALLWREGGGAVAVLAPTSLTLPADQSFLSLALFQAVFRDRAPTLGQALLQAKRQTPTGTAQARDVMDTFLLFGDPALRLAYPLMSTSPVDSIVE